MGLNFIFSFFGRKANLKNTRKEQRLSDARSEANACHPKISPPSLICSISLSLLREPVITPEGFIYEKSYILEALRRKKVDPQTNTPLTAADLADFPEILTYVEIFQERVSAFNEKYEDYITAAREYAHNKFHQVPELFRCPLSGEIFKEPVITSDGTIYELTSLRAHTEIKADYVPFPEFKDQINIFLFQRKEEGLLTSTTDNSTSGDTMRGFNRK